MTRATLHALLSHWWRNPLQLFTLLAGLALATALWSGVQAVNAEARASYDAAAATLGEGQYDRLTRRDGQPMDQTIYVRLRRAGWLVSPVVQGRLDGVRIVGVEPLTAPGGIGPVNLSQDADIGSFLTGAGQLFGNAETAARLPDLDVIISPQTAPGTAVTDIGVAQDLLGKSGRIDSLIVLPAQPQGRPALADIAPELTRQQAQGGSDVGRLTDSFHLNLTAFGLLSFAVGIFIVNGAIGLAFEQRRPVVRTLRALGLPLRRLIILMAAELMIFALVAGIVGVALGYVIAALLLPDVAATLRGLYGADVSGTLQLRPSWWLSGLAIALGGTALAASGALYKLSRMPLLAAAQHRALAMAAGKRALAQGAIAVCLLIMSAVLMVTADGLIGGFTLLGALLIGAALALPLILDQILRVAGGLAKSVTAQWFWADTRQQLPGLSLALMALLLAMAANVGVSTMVSSFRLTFTAFLDQRLASELYVSTEDARQTAALIAYAAETADALLPIQSAETDIEGQPTQVFGARDHATYRDNWAFLQATPDPWDTTFAGQTILINEQLSRRAGLDLGDEIRLQDQTFTVAGVYGDYGNPIGQALINEAQFFRLYPDVMPDRFGVRMPAEKVPEFVAGLEAQTGIPPSQTINQAGIKAISLAIFERTFTVTTALNILTLAVAGFAILMSLLTLATMRVPQLAPAWAMGMTRARLGRLELMRAVLLAMLTAIVALPLGLALAWALLAVVNVAAFGWQLPMYIFPWDYARLGLFALLAAALAALWPARKLARTPPADLLKVFSNER
ncbi:ABC transporter permease [Yoonia sediminilitoris]|uniref:Putative ABC transport system permease protein n=1 Tax=Yoonia sediminilitoris TaxID=1286148 RepID=A0A2T6KPE8_9RHOB|nr:ABC transporter permease [Yoonia sediminilitoris]PUB18443.1 putative ABC transport system permease protein [Yoonia sediminilitoris]RCW98611.1 putative ABC transport system permease protein [Yoonia sediminilitoris]